MHVHLHVVGDGPRKAPGKPNITPAESPKKDDNEDAHDPPSSPLARCGRGEIWVGVFHGKAGHVEDSFCRNRAVILNLP